MRYNEERNLFKNWNNWIFVRGGKKINFNPYLIPFTKITLRWTTDVKVNSKPIKIFEKNI